jgi:hypothetical protein
MKAKGAVYAEVVVNTLNDYTVPRYTVTQLGGATPRIKFLFAKKLDQQEADAIQEELTAVFRNKAHVNVLDRAIEIVQRTRKSPMEKTIKTKPAAKKAKRKVKATLKPMPEIKTAPTADSFPFPKSEDQPGLTH